MCQTPGINLNAEMYNYGSPLIRLFHLYSAGRGETECASVCVHSSRCGRMFGNHAVDVHCDCREALQETSLEERHAEGVQGERECISCFML